MSAAKPNAPSQQAKPSILGRDGKRLSATWRTTATYAFHDIEGKARHFEECRERAVNGEREKTFRQYHLDEHGEKVRNLDGVRRLPYNLPALMKSRDKTIVVVEGPMDADNMAKLGYLTTAKSGGTKWAELAEHFRGRETLVVADNDESGRNQAREAVDAFVGVASKTRVIYNLPDVPEKGDVSDLIAQGWKRDMFDALFETATLVEPPPIEDGAALLGEIAHTYLRYVVMPAEQADTLALFVLHTHAFEAADVTPYLFLRSAEKRSGKTRTLRISKDLCRSAVLAANVTPAPLFRLISASAPAFFLDEIDTLYGKHHSERNEDIRAILNAGFERGATVPRCVGDRYEVEQFEVFCPKMFAGLRCSLPDTILDRSIIFEMERKSLGEKVERFRRRRDTAYLRKLGDRAKAWAKQNVAKLVVAEPELPDELNDRAQDMWEPLFAIADLAGGNWPERARKAALRFSTSDSTDDESRGTQLLRDIRAAFDKPAHDKPPTDRFTSAALAQHLGAIEESPWGPVFGRDFDARALARLLKPFAIRPKTVRFDDRSDTAKGYLRADFEKAWARYLGTHPPGAVTTVTPSQVNKDGLVSTELPVTRPELDGNASVTKPQPSQENPHEIGLVTDVTDVTVVFGLPRSTIAPSRRVLDGTPTQEPPGDPVVAEMMAAQFADESPAKATLTEEDKATARAVLGIDGGHNATVEPRALLVEGRWPSTAPLCAFHVGHAGEDCQGCGESWAAHYPENHGA